MKIIELILGLLSGAGSLFTGFGLKTYVTLGIGAIILFSGWYLYDDIFVEPLETSQEETKACLKTLSTVNDLVIDMNKEFDANISTVQAQLKKCVEDTATYSLESFEQGRLKGIQDAEANKTVTKDDVDAICFQPYF